MRVVVAEPILQSLRQTGSMSVLLTSKSMQLGWRRVYWMIKNGRRCLRQPASSKQVMKTASLTQWSPKTFLTTYVKQMQRKQQLKVPRKQGFFVWSLQDNEVL